MFGTSHMNLVRIELVVIAKYQSSFVKYLNAFKQSICQTNYFDKRKAFFNIH